ncbi:uncharacterized protein LOC144656461 [Oculina patagonica]
MALNLWNLMDNETNGLTDGFLARHTTDPALLFQLHTRNRESPTSNRPTGSLTENTVPLLPTSLPLCMSDHTVESVGSTNNSRLATQQGVARATASMHRVMEEKRFRKEMKRREKEIREQRARDRIEREAREMFEANKWPPQQGAIPGPVCTSLNEKITRNTICGYCCRPKYVSRSSVMNTDFGQTDSCESTNSPLPDLKQNVEETCPLAERVLGEREEREEFESEIERKERENKRTESKEETRNKRANKRAGGSQPVASTTGGDHWALV